MKFKFKDLGKLFKTTWKEWNEKDPFRQSAVIAYYAIFSLPALLVVVITFAGWFYGTDAVSGRVIGQVSDTMGPATAEQVKEMLAKAGDKGKSVWAIIIGTITILFGATGVFAELQKSLNIIWEVKAAPAKGIWPIVKARLFSFGLIITIGFLLLISLVISSILVAMSDWLNSSSDLFALIFNILNFVISFGVITALFALMFKILPDAEIKWRHVWIGSMVTALLFVIGKYALSFYFGKAEPGSDYGAAGSVILIMLWVSYSSMLVFFGAEFTRAFANLYDGPIPASETGVRDLRMRRKDE